MDKPRTADQAFVRRLNTSIVMDSIRFFAPLSRAELAVRTGLNRSTVSSIIDDLIDQGFVHETNREDPKIGRPGMLLQINPEGGFAIGVEIGVDFIFVILTNFIAEVLWHARVPIAPSEPQIAILERAENMIEEAMEYGASLAMRPLGIGVGVPGLVDIHLGKLVYAPNLKWSDMPIRLMWMRRFNLPVFVENEANCAALGEYFYGVAHDVKNSIYIKTGVGLGGGIMIGGRLFKGTHGFGGEIGHVTIYQGGETCGCGRVGCWETYVSSPAILRFARHALEAHPGSLILELANGDPEQLTPEIVIEAAGKSDPAAISVLEEVGGHLAVGAANLVNIFNPEMIVLGGMLAPAGPWVIPVMKDYFQKNLLWPLRDSIRIEVTTHIEDATTLGAVALVLDDIVREPVYAL